MGSFLYYLCSLQNIGGNMDEYEVTLEGYQPVWTTVLVKANGRNDAESRAMDQRNWLDEEVEWEPRNEEVEIGNPIDVR
jgi:hypothetical protein|tara:strand:- start:627 stop:863 length:237 start_codon:yes stop_codon:yes gene_type:complete